jgi:nicotinamide mononucleotide (NMN) deamidase PncC
VSIRNKLIQGGEIKFYYPGKTDSTELLFPHLIEPGSINELADLAIPVLGQKGYTISTSESSATLAEIVSALTIVGSGSVVTRSQISPDFSDNESIYYKKLVYGINYNDPEAHLKTLTYQGLLNKEKSVSLVTLGNFRERDHKVHIGLGIRNQNDDFQFESITLSKDDYKKLDYDEASIDIQKQFVADKALRLLLNILGVVQNRNIPFKPQEVSRLLDVANSSIMKGLSEYLHGRKIVFFESCTGGFLTKTLTNYKETHDLLSSGQVLYNTEEKLASGVSDTVLVQDDLYGKDTAAELARAAYQRDKSSIAIGVTGLLDTPDTRTGYENKKPGDVYYSIIIPGYRAITEKVSLPTVSRIDMKADLSMRIFQRLLVALIQNEFAEMKNKS